MHCMTATHSIGSMLKRMYNQEFEEPRCRDLVPQDDMKAIRLAISSIENANVHYTIGLPCEDNPEILPGNKIWSQVD